MNTLKKHTASSIKKLFNNDNYEFHIKNNKVNGNYDGASGFILNKSNGKIVYVSVSLFSYEAKIGYMYRTAESLKDFCGGHNHYAKNDMNYADGVSFLLA